MDEKRDKMQEFWSERAKLYRSDPRANTNDIWLRNIEIRNVDQIIKKYRPCSILDFGCANGYTTVQLAKNNPNCSFTGIDINQEMIIVAQESIRNEGCSNLMFQQLDILHENIEKKFDFIYSIRAIQNIESAEKQRYIFDKLLTILKKGSLFFSIESYADAYESLNHDRTIMNLPPLPIHSHLTLLTEEFDRYVMDRVELLERTSPSSSYYLITRLLYSYIAMVNREPIDYNHPIHQVAAMVPQIGEYGPQRALLCRKR